MDSKRGGLIAFAICVRFRDTNLLINQMYYLLFVMVIVMLTMRVKISNKLFWWCGKNLLGLYILQRIPMILCSEFGLVSKPYLSLFICAITTIILTSFYHKYIVEKIRI